MSDYFKLFACYKSPLFPHVMLYSIVFFQSLFWFTSFRFFVTSLSRKKQEHKSTFSIEVALDNATKVSPCSFSESPHSIDSNLLIIKKLSGDSWKKHGLTFVALSRATNRKCILMLWMFSR